MSVFEENARAVFIEQAQAPSHVPAIPREARRGGWWNWMVAGPALAMLAAGVFAGYEAGERKFVEPQAIDQYAVHGLARGIEAETVVKPRPESQFFTLYMDRSWDRDYSSYRAVVRDAAADLNSGPVRASLPIPPPKSSGTISVLFRAHELTSGRYVLSILGKDAAGQETKVADYSFTLRFE